jgi:biotin carboxyl carrier protein
MDTSTATRDLTTEVASLRIERDGPTRLRDSRYGGMQWVGLALLLGALFAGWEWLTASRAVRVQTVTVTARTAGRAAQTALTASGYVTARRRRATVSSRVMGKLSEVLVEPGMPVRQGQVLARIDDSVTRAALDITDAQAAAAQCRRHQFDETRRCARKDSQRSQDVPPRHSADRRSAGSDAGHSPRRLPGADGTSGSGKTTLLNLVGGLDQPSEGAIEMAGDRIDQMSAPALARWRSNQIGFIFQLYNLLPMLTAERNVELPLLLTTLTRSERKRHVQTALSLVGLSDRGKHCRGNCQAAKSSVSGSREPS